jgi:predicted Zn-dependent protease
MGAGRGYDIFPRTFKARLLLASAFLAGLAIIGSYLAVSLVTFDFFDFLDEVEVTVENRTDRLLTIYVAGQSEAVVTPGDTTAFTTQKISWKFGGAKVQAVDSNGVVVFEDDLDLGDLERMDYRIVIEPPAEDSGSVYPPCYGSELPACLGAQTGLQAIARDSCEGSGRRVCLVPLGQVSPELIEHFVDHYAEQYGIPASVLAPVAIPRELVDPLREQVDGVTLIDYAGSLFPEEYVDSDVALIGLTPLDLYDRTSTWRFIFGTKGTYTDPKAVVSTFRMNPQTFGEPRNDELLFSRARKLVTKYIGLLYYGLEESDDPKSPLYNNILSLRDLDRMREPLVLP